jgi:excisionase family DNA binding protein
MSRLVLKTTMSEKFIAAASGAFMLETTHLIDTNELSRLLSVPKGTLYQWVYLRRIPFIKAGRSLRFDPQEVLQSLPHSPTMDQAGQRWKGH